ncbi:UNVERIFIED_CONTAM: hypothetical protein FKN15_032130 [Acipenser sinensis]
MFHCPTGVAGVKNSGTTGRGPYARPVSVRPQQRPEPEGPEPEEALLVLGADILEADLGVAGGPQGGHEEGPPSEPTREEPKCPASKRGKPKHPVPKRGEPELPEPMREEPERELKLVVSELWGGRPSNIPLPRPSNREGKAPGFSAKGRSPTISREKDTGPAVFSAEGRLSAIPAPISRGDCLLSLSLPTGKDVLLFPPPPSGKDVLLFPYSLTNGELH